MLPLKQNLNSFQNLCFLSRYVEISLAVQWNDTHIFRKIKNLVSMQIFDRHLVSVYVCVRSKYVLRLKLLKTDNSDVILEHILHNNSHALS